jgi:hypothetical protein
MRGWEGWGVFRSDNPRCENWISATKLTSILQSVDTRALGGSFLFISFYLSPCSPLDPSCTSLNASAGRAATAPRTRQRLLDVRHVPN